MELDPHPAFHNAIVFQYWFGLISFAKERKASFTRHNCRQRRQAIALFFWGG
jgi:hypothetical protein